MKPIRKGRLVLAALLIIVALGLASKQFQAQTGQGCGQPSIIETRVHWLWQWLPNRGDNQGFIACVGPSQYMVYRPLDLAAGLLLVAVALARFKKYQPK